jgi:hypothetical protein
MAKFTSRVVVDDNGTPLADAIGKIYNINDATNSTPLEIRNVAGVLFPLDELPANNDGVTPEFTVQDSMPVVKWVSGDYQIMMTAYDQIPEGGNPGQLLTKFGADDWDMGWSDPSGIPSGGPAGAVLTKVSAADFDTEWADGVVNVKTMGAVGNGLTDDSPAIQAALDLGIAVYVPQGNYLINSTLRIEQDGTVLIGEGPGNRKGATQDAPCTRFLAGPNLTGQILLVQRAANDRPLASVGISGISLDGDNRPGIEGLLFRANHSVIDDVNIWQCTGNGLRIQGYASPYWDTYDTIISRMRIADSGGAGIFLDNNATDLHFYHCVIFDNQDNLQAGGGGSSFQVTGCHFYSASRYNIFFNGAGSRSKFSNCKIEGAGNHGVVIDSTNGGYSDIQFTGCGFSSQMTTSAHNTWDLVHITGPSAAGIGRTTFVGNNFNSKGGLTVKPRFAINMATSAAQGTVIVGNSFGTSTHWGTAPLNNGSNSSLLPYVRNNAGQPDLILPNVKSATYTLTTDDAMGFPVEMNSASAVSITVPPNAQPGFQKGAVVTVTQTGTGQITFVAGAGVTLRTPRSLTTRAQWSTVTLRQTTTNTWILSGDLT